MLSVISLLAVLEIVAASEVSISLVAKAEEDDWLWAMFKNASCICFWSTAERSSGREDKSSDGRDGINCFCSSKI